MLASQYGWSFDEIYNHIYIEQLLALVPQIERRMLEDYKMQLAIAQNPHVKNPKELWRMLERAQDKKPELDTSSIENLKYALGKGSRVLIK